MPIEREETGIDGISIVRQVPMLPPLSGSEGSALHFTGVERGPGGFNVRAFLFNEEWKSVDMTNPDNYSRENQNCLGEIQIYATSSPTVALEERMEPLQESLRPLPLDTYETFIDVSPPENPIPEERTIDVLVALITHDGQTLSSDHFQFSGLSFRSSNIEN